MSLDAPVALAVLGSALLHASWNALTKSGGDPLLTLWGITITGSALAGVAAFFVPLPAPAAWPYLAVSLVLHGLYQLALAGAYRIGDLSQVYPIARGLAPCAVAAAASVFAGEALGPWQWAGLGLASGGIASLALVGVGGEGFRPGAVGAALGVGLLIGSYTTVDGLGVRIAGQASGFIAWSLLLDGTFLTVYVVARRRGDLPAFLRRDLARASVGGLMATAGYAIVLWAMSRGGLAQVASLRETSVIAAALIGTRLLGEPFGGRRIAAALAVASGIAILNT